MKVPRISVVTPNKNGAEYLERAILSVLNQNYPNLEYIIIDGDSTDGSLDILNKFMDKLAFFESTPDKGLYHALQKGFSNSSGEIMMWINSDDLLHPHAFQNISETFQKFPKIKWITGINTFFDVRERVTGAYPARSWSKYDYYSGNYEWIQQESTVWRRELWTSAGSYIDTTYSLAGDMELWMRFFRHATLHSCGFLIGGFRQRPGQLSSIFMKEYHCQASNIVEKELTDLDPLSKTINRRIHFLQRVKTLLRRTVILDNSKASDKLDRLILQLKAYPPRLTYDPRLDVWELL